MLTQFLTFLSYGNKTFDEMDLQFTKRLNSQQIHSHTHLLARIELGWRELSVVGSGAGSGSFHAWLACSSRYQRFQTYTDQRKRSSDEKHKDWHRKRCLVQPTWGDEWGSFEIRCGPEEKLREQNLSLSQWWFLPLTSRLAGVCSYWDATLPW